MRVAAAGGRRVARGIRGGFPAQRGRVGRCAAALSDHGPLRGRGRLLAGDD